MSIQQGVPSRKELSAEPVLLGLLSWKPMHGYELYQNLTSSPLRRVWYLGISQMYKLLKELEALGYVEGRREVQENRPFKRIYHITPPGREAFLHWLETPVINPRLIRVEFLAKLFLAQPLGPETVGQVINAQMAACRRRLARLQEEASDKGFEHLVFRFRSGQIQAIIDWLEYCRSMVLDQGISL